MVLFLYQHTRGMEDDEIVLIGFLNIDKSLFLKLTKKSPPLHKIYN